MLALLAELSDEFPPMRMFRPNRDVRFAKDKCPYKLWAGATSESHAVGGTGYYVSVSASGLVTGCGAMALARDQLQHFRAALDDDHSGAAPPLSTGPRGYPSDHPRAEPLRWKGAVVIREYERADWMHTRAARDRILKVWHGARPLKEWIDAHVGATDEPVRSARGRQK